MIFCHYWFENHPSTTLFIFFFLNKVVISHISKFLFVFFVIYRCLGARVIVVAFVCMWLSSSWYDRVFVSYQYDILVFVIMVRCLFVFRRFK